MKSILRDNNALVWLVKPVNRPARLVKSPARHVRTVRMIAAVVHQPLVPVTSQSQHDHRWLEAEACGGERY